MTKEVIYVSITNITGTGISVRVANVFMSLTYFASMVHHPSVIDRSEINQRFGYRLAQCRKRAGFSQEKLAKALRLTRTSITNIEHGRQPIQLPTLYAIADALGLDPTDLMPGVPKLTAETSADREQLKGLSAKTTNWLAKLSGDLPAKKTEATDASDL